MSEEPEVVCLGFRCPRCHKLFGEDEVIFIMPPQDADGDFAARPMAGMCPRCTTGARLLEPQPISAKDKPVVLANVALAAVFVREEEQK